MAVGSQGNAGTVRWVQETMADPHGIHKAPSDSKRVPAGVPRIRKESIHPEFFGD